jgi:hypothetical protein
MSKKCIEIIVIAVLFLLTGVILSPYVYNRDWRQNASISEVEKYPRLVDKRRTMSGSIDFYFRQSDGISTCIRMGLVPPREAEASSRKFAKFNVNPTPNGSGGFIDLEESSLSEMALIGMVQMAAENAKQKGGQEYRYLEELAALLANREDQPSYKFYYWCTRRGDH